MEGMSFRGKGYELFEPPHKWAREKMEPLILLTFFPLFCSILGGGQFEGNTCFEARCDLVGFPLFYRHFGCFGASEAKFTICPYRPPK